MLKFILGSRIPYFSEYFPRKLFFFEFGLMYCDPWSHYIKAQKPFKGRNYSRKYGKYKNRKTKYFKGKMSNTKVQAKSK